MAEFTYEARASDGQMNTGTLTANSEREAMMMLDARGLFPLRIQAAAGAGGRRWGGRRVKSRVMTTFYSQLADLIHSGVPLLRSIDILERQAQAVSPRFGFILREVRAKVADGTSLADAMNAFPNAFNELAVSMV